MKVSVPENVHRSHDLAAGLFGQAGTWLTASIRTAVWAEARNAPACTLCRDRKQAISPYALKGKHDSCTQLPENIVEVVHSCLLYTSPSPRDQRGSRMPSSA